MRGVSKHVPSPLRGDAKAHGHPQRANASRPSLAAGEAQAAQTLSAENSDGDTCRPTAKDAQLSEWPVYTRPTIAPINCALAGSGLGPVLNESSPRHGIAGMGAPSPSATTWASNARACCAPRTHHTKCMGDAKDRNLNQAPRTPLSTYRIGIAPRQYRQ